MINYQYLISYHHQNGSKYGFGNLLIEFTRKIKNLEDVKNIMNYLKEQQKEENVTIIILNYKFIGRRFSFNGK